MVGAARSLPPSLSWGGGGPRWPWQTTLKLSNGTNPTTQALTQPLLAPNWGDPDHSSHSSLLELLWLHPPPTRVE